MIAPSLARRFFRVRDGSLWIGDISVRDIAEQAGTPCYVYDAGVVRRQYAALENAVGGFAEVHYSVKANPNPAVARLLMGLGAGLEVASAAEYECARRAGCPAQRILFAGPGKTNAELSHVLARGIGEIHVESENEIARLAAIALDHGGETNVALRVNPGAAGQGGAMIMGGRSSQFGVDEERMLNAVDLIAGFPSLRLTGVHLFAGTQILESEALERQWAHGLDLAARVARHLAVPLETVDLGGGLGIPYYSNDGALDLEQLAEISARLAGQKSAEPLLAGARVILEPGRFLVGPAGVYLTSVTDVKVSRGTRFVILDGGMNHHLAASGNLGQVIKKDYPLLAAEHIDTLDMSPAVVVGPLCTPLDTLGRTTAMPDLKPGDLVSVLQSGAYGLSASPVGFLSHPMPAEVLVDGGKLTVIRPRGSFGHPITGVSF